MIKPPYSINLSCQALAAGEHLNQVCPLEYRMVVVQFNVSFDAAFIAGVDVRMADLYTGVNMVRFESLSLSGIATVYFNGRMVISDLGDPLNGYAVYNEGVTDVDVFVSGFLLELPPD